MPATGYGGVWDNNRKKDPNDTQCLIMNVYKDIIEIDRCNYRTGKEYAKAWTIS
jgi:hypothetical protein